eukprot:jgi/Ulvmu1/10184/UM006_0140.1
MAAAGTRLAPDPVSADDEPVAQTVFGLVEAISVIVQNSRGSPWPVGTALPGTGGAGSSDVDFEGCSADNLGQGIALVAALSAAAAVAVCFATLDVDDSGQLEPEPAASGQLEPPFSGQLEPLAPGQPQSEGQGQILPVAGHRPTSEHQTLAQVPPVALQ